MPKLTAQPTNSSEDRRREVASILVRGVVRWRQQVKAGQTMPVSRPENGPRIRLEIPAEGDLSVSLDTRVLAMRDGGDDE